MAGPTIPVQAPSRTPRTGGLSDVAEFRSNDRLGVADGIVWQTNGCTFPNIEELRCYAQPLPADKTLDGISLENGIGAPFTIYAAVECTLSPNPDQQQRARALHEGGSDRVLEEELWQWGSGGVALAAGGSPLGAIGKVEQALDDTYVGRGVILMSREDAVIADAAGGLHREGGQLYTINGTPVVASGRVPTGTVYGFGAIIVEHSDLVVNEVENLEYNKRFALAEAVYVIGVDCEFRVKSTTTI